MGDVGIILLWWVFLSCMMNFELIPRLTSVIAIKAAFVGSYFGLISGLGCVLCCALCCWGCVK